MTLVDRHILYSSTNHAWSYGWTFYQMVAEALARANDVVYVDAPRSLARLRDDGGRTPPPRLRIVRTWTFPLQRTEPLRSAAARLNARLVARWAARARFRPDIVWTYTPYELPLAQSFPGAAVVYWTGDEVVIPGEEALLERADLLLCVSEPVHERHAARFGAKAHFVPVACDFDRYHAALDATPDEEVAALPRPVFGYSGFLNARIDVGLLTALADAAPGASVVVAGPRSLDPADEKELARRANVHLLGPQAAERVPRLIRGFDVGLMPYKDTDFNRNANPVKFYEYLAVARPVVSTDIPTLNRFAGVASLGGNDTFVERALAEAERPTGAPGERIAVAREHSLDALLGRLEALPL